MSAHYISQNGRLEWSPRIFVVVDVYLPGFKSGGPLRTIVRSLRLYRIESADI